MSDDSQRPIIVKKIKKSAHGHHGGAWKLAYADLVTAMMAFFLLMWLLGSSTKAQLQGISEYFQTPLLVAMFGGEGSGDSSSVIRGGGSDLTATTGQTKQGELPREKQVYRIKRTDLDTIKAEAKKLNEMRERMGQLIDKTPTLNAYRNQLLIDITPEGLRIQIVDEKNRPMFASGSAQLQPHTKEILHEIAKVLNEVDNRISLSGHTDATPYGSGDKGYSNWELSADRANASRRELIVGGIKEDKVLRVVGLGSSVHYDPTDPTNPINRRISIIVLNKQTTDAILENGGRQVLQPDEEVVAGQAAGPGQ